uniref:Uncharacterized protein n=1 Tax=Heterorhabditis bacteriophora TaxID=37862 RepID=A0A1I7W7A0_HETBA
MRRFSQADSLRHPAAPLLSKLGKAPADIPESVSCEKNEEEKQNENK